MLDKDGKEIVDEIELIDEHEDEDEEETLEDGEELEDEDSEEEDESEDDDADNSVHDKKEAKIVALKREVKEANRRIEELEQAKAESNIDIQMQAKKEEMLNDGYSERDVERFVTTFKENALLKQKQEEYEWEKLANKYPRITMFKKEIAEFRKTLPTASIEDIYLAKFSKSSAYDEKTRIQQEALYKRSKSTEKGKASVTGDKVPSKPVKLSPSDERAYKIAVKANPSLTKANFKALLEEEELT